MPKDHIVLRGDCFSSLAKSNGFEDYHILYEDAKNAGLKGQRSNPNTLDIGDRVSIPDKQPLEANKGTGAKHKFVIKKKVVRLRLVFIGHDDAPVASKAFEIHVAGVKPTLKTDGKGLLEMEIAADLKDGDIEFRVVPAPKPPAAKPPTPAKIPYPPPIDPAEYIDEEELVYTGRTPEILAWKLEIGALASFNTLRGVRSRLWNLGFESGPEGPNEDPILQAAIKSYQAKHKLPETGKAADIQAHLRDRHDFL